METQATVPASPEIVHVAWGRVDVAGHGASFKDVKCFPGGARGWDWNETGTRHEPGIQIADAQELIDRGARIVVLGCGMYERLQVRDDTLAWLADRDATVHVLPTPDAVERYNRLCEEGRVGALIHSTC